MLGGERPNKRRHNPIQEAFAAPQLIAVPWGATSVRLQGKHTALHGCCQPSESELNSMGVAYQGAPFSINFIKSSDRASFCRCSWPALSSADVLWVTKKLRNQSTVYPPPKCKHCAPDICIGFCKNFPVYKTALCLVILKKGKHFFTLKGGMCLACGLEMEEQNIS